MLTKSNSAGAVVRKRVVRSGLAVLALAAGMLLPTSGTASAAATAGCYSHGCDGKDPQAMGCTDGRTLDTKRARGGSLVVELRASYACNAAWVRYSNYHGFSGAVYIKSLSTEGLAARTELKAYPQETGWTGMVSFSDNVIGCHTAWFQDGGWWTECTGNF
ncbi:DUF2690 domain-containing protein [Streptomyces sp. NPDC002073]|uniref:DUF2690 domain-containing protein n=1 Tax=Streptomyces sp. NBC_00239 TaxID=2903640 RepID=UPI002E27BDE3|nr:DUF2690 domain-containing protein [Streptomyces sp. NBC_00239]